MSDDQLGRVRRSQVIMTHGPGAIVDFRAGGGAAVSVVTAGLDEWDRSARPAGLLNPQRVSEPRLEASLNVRGFRLPPVSEEPRPGREPDPDRPVLPAVRFPEWLTCPSCNLIQPVRRWTEQEGNPAPYCRRCSDTQGERVHVVPVRFIVACEHGHLDEFPWREWIEHASGCGRAKPLKLEGVGAGLRGLELVCTGCNARRSMDGAFSPHTLRKMEVRCSGRRPWLPGPPEQCPATPVVVQRGASNLYFPAMESALSIPPWDDELQAAMGEHWAQVMSASTPEDRDNLIRLLVWPVWEGPEQSVEELQRKVRARVELLASGAVGNLRFDEYQHLRSDRDTTSEKSELALRSDPVPASLAGYVEHVTQVVRLREVRAIYGFSRIHPPSGGFGRAPVAKLSRGPKHWLPAVEVRGEGVFLTLDPERLKEWETRTVVVNRAGALDRRRREELRARFGDDYPPGDPISPRFVLLHTLSHALMRELSLECGYSTSSLRERLYVEERAPGMGGVLIYTATSDADGTLGGLVRQGRPDRFETLFLSALGNMQWCSSDPLCMSGVASFSDGLNGAACHACAMAPETSCETFNRFLDRALLVGSPGDEHRDGSERTGFFHGLAGTE